MATPSSISNPLEKEKEEGGGGEIGGGGGIRICGIKLKRQELTIFFACKRISRIINDKVLERYSLPIKSWISFLINLE